MCKTQLRLRAQIAKKNAESGPNWMNNHFRFWKKEGEEEHEQLSDGDQDDDSSEIELVPEGKARDETFRFQNLALESDTTDSTGLIKLESFWNLSSHKWWCDARVSALFPVLSRFALGFLSMIPGHRGLECNIGSSGDIAVSKRSRSRDDRIHVPNQN